MAGLCLAGDVVLVPIPGSRDPRRVVENAAASELRLSAA
jgi:diketogulonate reductase-like aldo/keto reductase